MERTGPGTQQELHFELITISLYLLSSHLARPSNDLIFSQSVRDFTCTVGVGELEKWRSALSSQVVLLLQQLSEIQASNPKHARGHAGLDPDPACK